MGRKSTEVFTQILRIMRLYSTDFTIRYEPLAMITINSPQQ